LIGFHNSVVFKCNVQFSVCYVNLACFIRNNHIHVIQETVRI